MKTSVCRARYWVLAVVAVPVVLLAVGPKSIIERLMTQQSDSLDSSGEAANLAKQLGSEALGIRYQAGQLESFAPPRDQPSRERHAAALTEIRDEVGQMQEKLRRLVAIQQGIDPWQQYAIDHINLAVAGLADNLEAAIEFLNEDGGGADYNQSIAAVYDWAAYLEEAAGSAT